MLEEKCGAASYYNQGKRDQAKGDYDSALANFDQAIFLDPKYAEAYDSRGGIYGIKGDYSRAIADYDEALRLDPKLEDAANHRTGTLEKVAKEYASDALAVPQIKLQAAAVVPKKEFEPNGSELTPAKTTEQTNRDQDAPLANDKIASPKSQSESGSCRAKKSIYVADGVAGADGVKSVIEIILYNKHDHEPAGATHSEFIIQEYRNNQIL